MVCPDRVLRPLKSLWADSSRQRSLNGQPRKTLDYIMSEENSSSSLRCLLECAHLIADSSHNHAYEWRLSLFEPNFLSSEHLA